MMVDNLQVIVPSAPLSWWINSNISNWRYRVGIDGIRDADPHNLGIFDWKVLFEIALRDDASIWQLTLPIILGNKSIPILGSVQVADFVAGRVVFRLHKQTVGQLLKHHLEFVARHHLPPRNAVSALQRFQRRLDALQINLHAAVLTCTDGSFARGDFPGYASTPGADEIIVKMLDLVLKPTGLRRILLESFLQLSYPVPRLHHGGSELARHVYYNGKPGVSKGLIEPHVSPQPAIFPYNELQSLIFNNGPSKDMQRPASHSEGLRSKAQFGPWIKKRTYCRSPPSTKISSETKGKCQIQNVYSKYQNITPVLLKEKMKISGSSPEIQIIPRCLGTLEPDSSNRSSSPEAGNIRISDISQQEGGRSSLIPTPTPESNFPSEDHLRKPCVKPIPSNGLKQDELTIFKMDSSFTPVTRSQAALNKTPQSLHLKSGTVGSNIHDLIDGDETESEEEHFARSRSRPFNRFNVRLEEPSAIIRRQGREKLGIFRLTKKKRQEIEVQKQDSDFTDDDDMILDSDTPDMELLTDSADEAEHRDRKLRRRERKRLKREMLEVHLTE